MANEWFAWKGPESTEDSSDGTQDVTMKDVSSSNNKEEGDSDKDMQEMATKTLVESISKFLTIATIATKETTPPPATSSNYQPIIAHEQKVTTESSSTFVGIINYCLYPIILNNSA